MSKCRPRLSRLQAVITEVLEHQETISDEIKHISHNLEVFASELPQYSSKIRQDQTTIKTALSELATEHSTSARILRRIDANVTPESALNRRTADAYDITKTLLSSENFSMELASHLTPALQPLISKAIEKGFQATLDQQQVAGEMKDMNKSPSLQSPFSSSDLGGNTTGYGSSSGPVSESTNLGHANDPFNTPLSFRIVSRTIAHSSKSYDIFIGKLLCRTRTVVREEIDSLTGVSISQTKTFICRVIYSPREWVLRWLPLSKLQWMVQEIRNPSFLLSIEPLRIVRHDSAILTACASGSVEVVRQLLNDHQASIYDRDSDGLTLLDKALTFDFSGDSLDFRYIRPKIETAFWLIEKGVDSGATCFLNSMLVL